MGIKRRQSIKEKKGEYLVRLLMSIGLFILGIYIIAVNINSANGYAILVGLEIITGGILLAQNKFTGFRDKWQINRSMYK
jgi:uncharacterized membrane protein HdeD (DUF308 family)